MKIEEILRERILILDGAMGTMIQQYGLTEADFRGARFSDASVPQNGNNDLLSLTRPDVIAAIHEAYLAAGADIIETNTFNATSVSMADYGMEKAVAEINRSAARIARQAADRQTSLTPDKPRFVAGSVGPTNKTCSLSPDVNNPAFRAIDFDRLQAAYEEQTNALLEGGVDLLLIETIFDTLNAKAAIRAVRRSMERIGREVPLMLSVTLADAGGRTLSGQTLEAFWSSVAHARPLSIGLNCSFGARDMKPFLQELSAWAPCFTSAYPNAGLPNRFGAYDETPERMAEQVREFVDEKLVNIVGGCCGTTPAHIARYAELVAGASVRKAAPPRKMLVLSGLEAFEIDNEKNFVNIGERCNVAGSRKFLRLIQEKKYDEALEIARRQVEDGAQILDINMDDAMLDASEEMTHFLNLIASEPDICRVPLMVDSSKWEVIEAGLKCIQGKAIVNSISLKEGEELFLERARTVRELGAALIVMAFDETGQADTFARKTEVCARAYRLLTEQAGIPPSDIIFDPNVLAVATGIETHRSYGIDFIRATRWIKEQLPEAKVSGGVSNLSFSFRGNNYLREAMHAAFLYHAVRAGMDMGIVNPATAVLYEEIPDELLEAIEDVLLDRNEEATDRLIAQAETQKERATAPETERAAETERLPVEERLEQALIKGRADNLENDLEEALQKYGEAVHVIDGPLMSAMNKVGLLFGAGKMFLPQVVKTARTMKRAVAILQPVIERQKKSAESPAAAGKFLLATVKGDVHDIGKNIVSVVLACNNFEVIDLGVMVPADEIVRRAIAERVDFIGLSGLITPSLEEMCRIADELDKAGVAIPLMIGGATTSSLHTAVKIAPRYRGSVIHVKDAAQNPVLAAQWMNPEKRAAFVAELQREQQRLRETTAAPRLLSLAEAGKRKPVIDWKSYRPVRPAETGMPGPVEIPLPELRPLINWKAFFTVWRLGDQLRHTALVESCDHCRTALLAALPPEEQAKAQEAATLYREASLLLDELEREAVTARGIFRFFPAYSEGQTICIETPEGTERLETLRQQIEKKPNETAVYHALSDFIAPGSCGYTDYIGAFATTAGSGMARRIAEAGKTEDSFRTLLLQSLADRIAEAAAEWLHYRIRTRAWGYAPEEPFAPAELLKQHYAGIRPAAGYPSLPDQSLTRLLDRLLELGRIGIALTENGAMEPAASVSGFVIAHPEARYFHIGQIDAEQRDRYLEKRSIPAAEADRWLSV